MSIRQQIITALDTRLRTITTANGYHTNAGARVFHWLDRDLADTEIDALIYRDKQNEIVPETIHNYSNKVIVEIEVKTKLAENTILQVRKLIEDVYAAIAVDDRWSGLAIDSQPTGEIIDIQQADKIMGSAIITVAIEYETDKWSY